MSRRVSNYGGIGISDDTDWNSEGGRGMNSEHSNTLRSDRENFDSAEDSERYREGGSDTDNAMDRNTELSPFLHATEHNYFQGDVGTDGELDYAASDGERYISNPLDYTQDNTYFGGVRQLTSGMTGRQRKKLAARSKGGEFQAKRKKRRVYFCCICSELNIDALYEHLTNDSNMLNNSADRSWTFHVHADVLRMYKESSEISAGEEKKNEEMCRIPSASSVIEDRKELDTPTRIGVSGTQEVFVFEFGSVVMWGFSRGDEKNILSVIRNFITKGSVRDSEFEDCEDDMAFVTSPNVDRIVVGNDVITLPDETLAKQRLAVSYAIAQSTVLSLFEVRIEKKMEVRCYIVRFLSTFVHT